MATQIERATRQAGLHIPNLEETGRKLGKGSYGKVAEVRVRGKRYAGKKLHKIFYERDVPPADTAAIAQRFEEECRRMPHLKHPNIVQMIGVHFHPRTGQPTLVMELLDTSLTRYLEEHASVPPTVKHSILLGVASGLVYLHSLPPPLGPIIHRDLTANNVLLRLGEEVIAKIADLGQARITGRNPAQMAQQQLTVCPGNVDHMPPEAQIDDPVYGTALDVFSFGVVMLHTLAHEWPKPLTKLESAFRIRSEVERRKTYLDKIEGSLLKPLVVECLGDSAESRPAAGELIGALKLATKLHSQMQVMAEAHAQQIEELQQQLKEQQQHKQRLEHSIHKFHALQQQLQAQQFQKQRQTKALEQQVRQLELRNQELAHEHSEQKQKLEQEIRQHIQEKELLQRQLHRDQQQLLKTGQELIELKLQNQELVQIQSKQRQGQDQEVRAHENLHQKLFSIPLPQPQAQQWPPLPSSSFPLPLLPTSTPSHAPFIPPEPPGPNATQYQNVQYQSAGSGADLIQSKGNLEHTNVTQEFRKLYQQYPELDGLPPQQNHIEQPASDDDTIDLYGPEQSTSDDDTIDLYGDDSNPVPVDTQPGPPTEAEPPSFDFKRPVPTPRTTLSKQAKPHSVDEVEQDGEGGGRKHNEIRTSASGSDLLQYEQHSQSSEPSSPRRLDKPIPRPCKSHSPSPHSSAETSPSASPTPTRHKIPIPVSANTAAAERVDTCESDQSDLDQRRPNRQSIESLEKNIGQDNSKLWRQEAGKQIRRRSNAVSEPSNPYHKSAELNSSAKDEGESTATTDAELEEQYIFLWRESWICSYCTNLVSGARRKCDVCGRDKLETLL